MLQILMKFLPADKGALLDLALRMVSSLDTAEERKAVADYGLKMLADGKVTVPEWAAFGKKLGVFRLEESKK
tara:strand:- start:108 stop:323 length:216 start_codon:yes stop_codon:yes gene_type:complete